MSLFRKKKAYMIKWINSCYGHEKYHETVVLSYEESCAVSKFLHYHNAALEKIEILDAKEVVIYR